MLSEACFSDTDLDTDNITLTDQGKNGTTPNSYWSRPTKCGKAEKCQGHVTPFDVRYEKIRNHMHETAINCPNRHSLERKYQHLRINQIQ